MQLSGLNRALGERWVVGTASETPDNVVKSAGRVLLIIELFDVLRREAPVCEISELLAIPQSSTSVLLRSMVSMGYLCYNRDTRAYAPTMKVALLGSWINASMVSDGALLQLMNRVNQRTGESVVLAVRKQTSSQYIHVVQSTSAVRRFVVKGTCRSLITSSSGLALLSDLSDAEIKRLAVRINSEAASPDKVVSVSEVIQRVNDIRQNGYSLTHDVVTPGAGMISVLLPGRGERLVLGIGAGSDVLHMRKNEFLAVMQEEIAQYLGACENQGRAIA
jgi:DNA-binding IclR family transcriptional regulator